MTSNDLYEEYITLLKEYVEQLGTIITSIEVDKHVTEDGLDLSLRTLSITVYNPKFTEELSEVMH